MSSQAPDWMPLLWGLAWQSQQLQGRALRALRDASLSQGRNSQDTRAQTASVLGDDSQTLYTSASLQATQYSALVYIHHCLEPVSRSQRCYRHFLQFHFPSQHGLLCTRCQGFSDDEHPLHHDFRHIGDN